MKDLKLKDINLLAVGNTIQLVGAIWKGEGRMLLCMFPEHHGGLYDEPSAEFHYGTDDEPGEKVPVRTLNMNSDEWNKFIRQTDLLETEVLAKDADGKVAKIIIRKSGRQISQTVCWEVYNRDGYKCRYCGAGPGIPLTVDHLILWEEGGPSIRENLLTSCRKCNKTRGNTPYAEWIESFYYKRVSRGISALTREDNLAVVATLASIPRMLHKPNKRK